MPISARRAANALAPNSYWLAIALLVTDIAHVYLGAAAIDPFEVIDAAQERAFPGARWANDASDLALGDFEVDAAQHRDGTVALMDATSFDNRDSQACLQINSDDHISRPRDAATRSPPKMSFQIVLADAGDGGERHVQNGVDGKELDHEDVA